MKNNIGLIVRLMIHFTISLILLVLLVSTGMFILTEIVWPYDENKQDGAVFINLLVSFIIFIVLYGWYLGRPLVYIVGKIHRMAHGQYIEPEKYNKMYSSKTMKLKRPYSLYKELIIQLHTLSEELERAKQERSRLDTMQREWIAGISHDLKTPLTYIKGYSSMLMTPKYEWNQEEQTKFITEIQDKANHMEELIGDLNLSFRLEGQQLPLHLEKVDLVEYVRRVVADVSNDPRASEYSLNFETDSASVEIKLDVRLLQRALYNLLINAIVHNPTGTDVLVHIKQPTELSVVITIQDDGIGMKEEDINYLFNKYYRGTTTDHQSEGTGLGMAIAQQLVLAHEGKIDVTSRMNVGTSIFITLPLHN